jgi:hypothetical protein
MLSNASASRSFDPFADFKGEGKLTPPNDGVMQGASSHA